MKTVDPYHETRNGLVWCGDIIYFNVISRGGYRYAAVFKDVGSDQMEKFVLAHRSDTTTSFRAMIRRLRKDPRFSAAMKKHVSSLDISTCRPRSGWRMGQ
jgi:transposase InsO family protein